MTRLPRYGGVFHVLLAIPLVCYVLLVAGLVAGMFAAIPREGWHMAWSNPDLASAVRLSLVTTTISTILAMAIAIPSGYMLSRYRFPGQVIVDTVLDMPIILPPLVMGLALLLFFSTPIGKWLDRGIVPGGLFVYQPLGIVLAQVVVGCAYAVRVMKTGFDNSDRRYEEVAMTLGANSVRTFMKVALPATWHSLVASTVISWAQIIGLFGPVIVLCGTMRGRTEIMPTTIFLETSVGRIDTALVIACLMVVMSMTMLVVFKRVGGGRLEL